MRNARLTSLAVVCGLLASFSPALAQTAASAESGKAADGSKPAEVKQSDAGVQQREEAQLRYSRALELFNEGSFEAASLELRRAYELAPSFRILYNIGLVNTELNDYAAALSAFERYLADGGPNVPPERQAEVRQQIERLSGRVGFLTVTTDPAGADVTLDDLPLAKSPIATPIRVNAGRRRISVAMTGRLPQTRVIEVAGGDRVNLTFELNEPQSSAPPSRPLLTDLQPPSSSPAAPSAPPPRAVPWAMWGVTGALAVGAGTLGIIALRERSDQKSLQEKFGVTESELDHADTRVRRFALLTDVLMGATVIAGGVSLYLTLRTPNSGEGQVALAVRPNGVDARLAF
ncbi:MAG TPA: PEGA domain-containing protein [Polyangiaceae bacterium]|nr:PEGA domain-containing protein [Polyangiaceae bacterium]